MLRRLIFFTCLFFLCASPIYAWQIERYLVDIKINQDSSFDVVENIEANFSDQAKHGILRNIPTYYQDEKGNKFNIGINLESVLDENGKPWQVQEYQQGSYKVLKVGSPYQTYSGTKSFRIKYKVFGALLYLDDHDELFWNAIGNEWDAPIDIARIRVQLPGSVDKKFLKTTTYSGRSGLRETNLSTQILDDQTVQFDGRSYSPGEGVTIVIGWPKGMVTVVEKKFIGQPGAPSKGFLLGL